MGRRERSPPGAAQEHSILDFLFDVQSGARQDRGRNRKAAVPGLLRGMRFVARYAQAGELLQALPNQVVQPHRRGGGVFYERREALGLPLATVVAMERLVSNPRAPPLLHTMVGGYLACIWTALRFGDAQRSDPWRLNSGAFNVRGSCWRATPTARGQPTGLMACGAPGRPP